MIVLLPRARHLLAILMTLALVAGAFGRVSMAWFCEGRVCSSSLTMCCCVSPLPSRDGSCARGLKESVGLCEGQCSCEAVVTKAERLDSFPPLKAITIVEQGTPCLDTSAPVVVVLQVPTELESPQVRALPPPERLHGSPCIEHASLRAPPATNL